MSIIQELYNIFDKEQSKYMERKSSKNLVVLELSNNLAFLREGLSEKLAGSSIIAGLEDNQFKNAHAKGINLNTIQKKKLSRKSYGGIKEFGKYQGWSTEKLINNTYERINTLKKLSIGTSQVDVTTKLQYLFKYLMLVMAHIKGEQLTIKSSKKQ